MLSWLCNLWSYHLKRPVHGSKELQSVIDVIVSTHEKLIISQCWVRDEFHLPAYLIVTPSCPTDNIDYLVMTDA